MTKASSYNDSLLNKATSVFDCWSLAELDQKAATISVLGMKAKDIPSLAASLVSPLGFTAK